MASPTLATWYAHPGANADNAYFPSPPTQAGDVIVVALFHWENTSVSAPAGFTLRGQTGTRKALLDIWWYRVQPDTLVPAIIFNITDNANAAATHPVHGFLWIARDCEPDLDPFDDSCELPIQSYVGTDTPPVSVETSIDNTLLLYCSSHSTNATFTPPTDFHVLKETSGTTCFVGAVRYWGPAGPTGDVVGTWSTENGVSAWLGALRGAVPKPDDPPQEIPPFPEEHIPAPVLPPQEIPVPVKDKYKDQLTHLTPPKYSTKPPDKSKKFPLESEPPTAPPTPLWLTPKPATLAAVRILTEWVFTPTDQTVQLPGTFQGADGRWVWAEVSTKYPARNRPPRFVKVERIGGGQIDHTTDNARFLVECFAHSTAEAQAMRDTARSGLRNAQSRWAPVSPPDIAPDSPAAVPIFVRWYGNETGLAELAYPELLDYERAQFMCELFIAVNR